MWKLAWCFFLHKRINAEKQIWNLSFKNYYFGAPKKRVLGFWRKTPQNMFLLFRLWFSFKNNRRTNVLLVDFFENAKKVIDHQKRHFGHFWWIITVFVILIKITLVCILFLKLKQKKICRNFFYGFYFKTEKCTFWRSTNFFLLNCFLSFSF